MSLAKQAKVLSKGQVTAALNFLTTTRHPSRNRVIFLLSIRAGLRAKEIASLTWSMITDAEGSVTKVIRLTDNASKGLGGGAIPMSKDLWSALSDLRQMEDCAGMGNVVKTERRSTTSPQVIINLFATWYAALGFIGCSSHSGRRTFITNAAKNISRFGGSLRDVQVLARHRSLAMTQRYIEVDTAAMWKVVDAI